MKKFTVLLFSLFILHFTFAQKVVGYIDGSLADADKNAEKLQWDKLTDIIFGFIQPTNTAGALENPANFSNSIQKASFTKIKKLATANNVKFHFSSGGANFTIKNRLYSIASNADARKTYAKNVADILEAHNMDGFDLDWEFPTPTQVDEHVLLLKALREEFDKRGKGWSLAIAVGGETPSTGKQSIYHTDYVSPDAFQYIDYLNLMSYDIGASLGGNNHSSYKNALDNINDYAEKGCPKSKMILGVPFYSRGSTSRGAWKKYSAIASTEAKAQIAYESDNVGADYYNGKKTLQDKTKLIMDEGGLGIMIWEVTYDRLGNDPYSLLGAIDEAMDPYRCSAPKPDLGNAVSICGTNSVTLDAKLGPVAGLTFTWKDGSGATVGSNQSTYNATKAGTYTIEVSNGVCSQFGTVEVLGTLPQITLGDDINLCDPATAVLDAGVTGNGITFTWEKDGSPINNETKSTLVVDRPGNYKVTASASKCTPASANVNVTSELINVDHETVNCAGSNVTFTIKDDGSFEWFDAPENGTKLGNGKTYTTTINQTTTFYVQKLATNRIQGTGCDGLNEWILNEKTYSGGEQVSYQGKKYEAKWYAEKFNIPGSGDPWKEIGECSGINCKPTPVTVTVSGLCTSIEKKIASANISIVPNPVEDYASISFSVESLSTTSVTIINLQGQIVESIDLGTVSGKQEVEINTNDLAKGIYICKIVTGNKILTTKFSK